MSFVYAYKLEKGIKIISDTYPTIANNEMLKLEKRFQPIEYNNFSKYGFLKTIIYKSNITISSAGNVEHFNEFLRFLYQNNIEEIKIIISEAFNLNFRYNGDTDFIITTENTIYQITENGVKNVSSSWIGDKDAFDAFIKFQKNYTPDEIYYTKEVSEDIRKQDIMDLTIDTAFESLIKNPKINTVGGFVVRCILKDKQYKFLGTYVSEIVKSQIIEIGTPVNFDSSAELGGFTFMAPNSCKYYYGYFFQTNKYIVYKPGYTHDNYKYLSMPHIVDKEEECL